MLSKSRYLKGLKCEKALWLNKFKKEKAFYSERTKQIFKQGNDVGELAQMYFPGGTLALVDAFPNERAVLKTKELLDAGETTIYEATFVAHNTLVALDILHNIDGKWHAFEVKSTNSKKTEHVRDAAIQYYVMQAAGLQLEDISIMHFDRSYVRRGDIEPKKLFTNESVIHEITPYLKEIPQNIERFLQVFKNNEPLIQIGKHCDKPYACEFAQYCHTLPENKNLINNENKAELDRTITQVDVEGVKEFYESTSYPIYSLDFETVMEGIPAYDESRPYQQIPFQYSLHFQEHESGPSRHFEFFHDGSSDPREELIKSLIDHIGEQGNILVYNITFERKRLTELMRDFPKYKNDLQNILDRLVDLMPVFKKLIIAKATQKSASLKIVLPTFLPGKSYDDKEVANGMESMAAFKNLNNLNREEKEQKIQEMLDYCALDTEAVLELYNLLPTFIE